MRGFYFHFCHLIFDLCLLIFCFGPLCDLCVLGGEKILEKFRRLASPSSRPGQHNPTDQVALLQSFDGGLDLLERIARPDHGFQLA